MLGQRLNVWLGAIPRGCPAGQRGRRAVDSADFTCYYNRNGYSYTGNIFHHRRAGTQMCEPQKRLLEKGTGFV